MNPRIKFASFLTALIALVISMGTILAQKQIRLQDAVIRQGANKILLKQGFEFAKKSGTSVSVLEKSSQRLVGDIKCGSCVGGKCKTNFDGDGGMTCEGCGSKDATCTIDPY